MWKGYKRRFVQKTFQAVGLDKKARELDEKGATDPAALAQIYTEAADMQVLKFSAKHEAMVRCRKRAAELAGPKYSECAIQ